MTNGSIPGTIGLTIRWSRPLPDRTFSVPAAQTDSCSFQDFITEHGYYPTVKQMDASPMMPAHASAYLTMGMGYRAVKEMYFPDVPQSHEYGKPTAEE